MDIAVVVVNYRTAKAALDAVASVVPDLDGFAAPHVIVVDNDSQDGSFEQLQSSFTDPRWANLVTVVESKHNGGYGYGINVAVRRLLSLPQPPRYVYIINPDVVVEPGALKRLARFMDDHPDAGLVGGRIHSLADGPATDEVKAFRFPSLLSEFESTAKIGIVSRVLRNHQVAFWPAESCEVDWISGTSMLVRTEVLSSSILFDEGFFLYFEEVDFARRIRNAGWKVYYVEGANVGHIGSLATGMADEARRMPRYWFQARRRYFVKHHGAAYGAACDLAWICGYAVGVAKNTLLRKNTELRPRMWRDFIHYSATSLMKPAPEAEQNAAAL